MNIISRILLIFLIISFGFACEESSIEPTASDASLRIMAIGDSRVAGLHPEFESYRYELWKNLLVNEWDVDFLGTRLDEGNYPSFQDKTFDKEHEGIGGATTLSTLEQVRELSESLNPNLILLGIGGNDFEDTQRSSEEMIQTMEEIISGLRDKYNNPDFIVERIAPGRSDFMIANARNRERFNSFNSLLPDLAIRMSNSDSQIWLVDNTQGWTDNLFADQVHYNAAGAKLVADRYYAEIVEHVSR
ncbi:MAG: SGNH/GDSL hydrolase family protein [Bacteroidota bacterium]